ncbi:MAG: YlbF family regulator [Ruminococcaceae bacterium]|nr:YlbF family regulator [Oscillospiraceae bacterium]
MTELQIIELAKTLGKELKASKKFNEYTEAKKEFFANDELKTKLSEFKVQKDLLDKQAELTNADEQIIDAIGARAETLYREINEHPVYQRFQTAEQEFNVLLGAVNSTISSFLADTEVTTSSGCSGHCESCKSNCKH